MSRTIKGTKPPGYDYWSKRPNSKNGYGPIVKQITREKERMQAKEIVRKKLKELEAE